MKSITYLLLFFLFIVAFTAPLKAQEAATDEAEEETSAENEVVIRPETYAIQNRPYILNKELGLYYAYLPLDHFNHFHAFGASYLTYYNDYLAWEVFNVAASTNQSTGLADRLLNDYNAIPDTFDILKYYYSTSIVYTPIYMKHLYQNESIRFGDISFVAGAGLARFDRNGNSNMIEGGIISRFVGGPGFNFKLDVRYKVFTKSDLRPNLAIGLVFTYNFSDEVTKGVDFDED
ncbi:MAG: hypothetical protein K0R29_856 [Pseudobdellovibrio sp.]|nr:hypothetical protein [Pseudobdellovibrio sp.]